MEIWWDRRERAKRRHKDASKEVVGHLQWWIIGLCTKSVRRRQQQPMMSSNQWTFNNSWRLFLVLGSTCDGSIISLINGCENGLVATSKLGNYNEICATLALVAVLRLWPPLLYRQPSPATFWPFPATFQPSLTTFFFGRLSQLLSGLF
jgi:hypothetical protein